MTNQFEILKYALHAGAYLLTGLSIKELKNLNTLILFGSTARLSADNESDIDLFFDINGSKKSQLIMRKNLNKLVSQFYLTNIALEFKSKGIDNEINIKIGKIEDWVDLAQSAASHGIILYEKYTKQPPALKAFTILSWEAPGKAKGALLNKIYGYKSKEKIYAGMLKKYMGIKIGGGAVMVPSKYRDIFTEVLEKYKVNYSRYDVWM